MRFATLGASGANLVPIVKRILPLPPKEKLPVRIWLGTRKLVARQGIKTPGTIEVLLRAQDSPS
jgi:hypothetical protein